MEELYHGHADFEDRAKTCFAGRRAVFAVKGGAKMRMMFKQYNAAILDILAKKPAEVNWPEVLNQHRIMVTRIQHERLIHLIVTGLVGIVMTIFVFMTVMTEKMVFLTVVIPLLLLFVGYIFHYRFLENTTQSWYGLEDKIRKNLD